MDLPDDLQRAEINPDELRPFTIPSEKKNDISNGFDKKFLDLLNNSKRPLVVPGYGIKLSKTQKKLFEFLKKQIFQLHQVGEPLIYFLAKMKNVLGHLVLLELDTETLQFKILIY